MEKNTLIVTLTVEELANLIRETLLDILHPSRTSKPQPLEELPLPLNKGVLTIKEAAQYLNMKPSTLYEKTSKRSIPHFKKGNRVFFDPKELLEWIKTNRIPTIMEIQTNAVAKYLRNR